MRAFVVGNGPSLTPEQLDKLIPEVSFAVNRIHLIYDKTKWRPDHWMFFDYSNSTVPVYVDDIKLHGQQGYQCNIRSDILDRFIAKLVKEQMESDGEWSLNEQMQNIKVWPQCPHIDTSRETTYEWHFPTICKLGGSVATAIQLAVMEGFNPIYLIGCDGNLKGNAYNHFTKDYVHIDAMTVEMAKWANETHDLSHSIAERECKERGVEIFNATVGGSATRGMNLCDFDDLFD